MDKKQVLLDHLAISKTTVTINATTAGVKLPSHLMSNTTVNINLSNKFAMPMQFKSDKLVAVLSFNGVPFECHIPYASIYAIRLADGHLEDVVVFDDEIPEDTKKMLSLFENAKDFDTLLFMADLKEQFDRDDITIGTYSNKPQ